MAGFPPFYCSCLINYFCLTTVLLITLICKIDRAHILHINGIELIACQVLADGCGIGRHLDEGACRLLAQISCSLL